MKALSRLAPAFAAALAVTAIAVPAASASAASRPAPASPAHQHRVDGGGSDAVFVLNDNTTANAVAAYHRAADGSSCACSVASVCGSRKAYESTHVAPDRPAEPSL